MGKFTIKVGKNQQFYFNLVGENGEIVLSSEGYTTRSGCLTGIKSVGKNAITEANFQRKISPSGRYYFVLNAANGQVIGRSQMYASEVGRENGIFTVMQNSKSAGIEEYAL